MSSLAWISTSISSFSVSRCVCVAFPLPWVYMLTCNLYFLQSIVCVVAIQTCKACNLINFRDFSADEARKCKHPRATF